MMCAVRTRQAGRRMAPPAWKTSCRGFSCGRSTTRPMSVGRPTPAAAAGTLAGTALGGCVVWGLTRSSTTTQGTAEQSAQDPRIKCLITDPRLGDTLVERIVKGLIEEAIEETQRPEPTDDALKWIRWKKANDEAVRRLETLCTAGGQQHELDKLINGQAFTEIISGGGSDHAAVSKRMNPVNSGEFGNITTDKVEAVHIHSGHIRVFAQLKAEATLKHPHYSSWTPDGAAGRKNDVDELSLRKELQKMGAPSTVLGEESQEYQALAAGFPKKQAP